MSPLGTKLGILAQEGPVIPAANLWGWWKADADVYNDAGSTLATDGQDVQQWNDQSGNGNHVTQTTSVNKPTFQTGEINGLPTIKFTSAVEYLENTSIPEMTAFTVFIVVDETDPWTYQAQAAAWDLSTEKLFSLAGGTSSTLNQFIYTAYAPTDGGQRSLVTLTATKAGQHLNMARYDGTSTGYSYNWDAVAQSVGTEATFSGTSTVADGFWIGSMPVITTFDFQGEMAEVIWYQNAISSADITTVQNYLNTKYSLY